MLEEQLYACAIAEPGGSEGGSDAVRQSPPFSPRCGASPGRRCEGSPDACAESDAGSGTASADDESEGSPTDKLLATPPSPRSSEYSLEPLGAGKGTEEAPEIERARVARALEPELARAADEACGALCSVLEAAAASAEALSVAPVSASSAAAGVAREPAAGAATHEDINEPSRDGLPSDAVPCAASSSASMDSQGSVEAVGPRTIRFTEWEALEPLLRENPNRFTLFPIK
jgi:hypothetical protein